MARSVIFSIRGVLTGIGVGFAVYYLARGLWWIQPPLYPPLMLAALVIYLATMLSVTFSEKKGSERMPRWAGIVAVLAAGVIPSLVSMAMLPSERQAPFATWYIGAVGLIGVACVIRRRLYFGLAVLAVLIISVSAWMGPANAFRLGLVGSCLWVVLAILMVWMWDRAVRDTEVLVEVQQRVSAWTQSGQARERERRTRVQYALDVAGPVLSRVVAREGDLNDAERGQARSAEAQLRDELRGGPLLNDAVRNAIAEIRLAGGSVTLLDEGGLEGVGEERAAGIRDELAQILRDAGSLRVIVRAARGNRSAVTVVGRVPGSDADDDDVALWREISR